VARRPMRRGRSRRKTAWLYGCGGPFSRTADGGFALATAFQYSFEGLTLARLRGRLNIVTSGTNGDSVVVALGIQIVDPAQFNVGITALELPWTDIGSENWIWHHVEQFTVPASSNNQAAAHTIDIDSKSMRKVGDGDVLVAVIELANETGTGVTVQGGLQCRQLVLLP